MAPSSQVMEPPGKTGRFTLTYYASDDSSCAAAPTTCPHRKGDLWKVTNALGQAVENTAYDAAGRVLSSRDRNGVVTDLEYDVRGAMVARKVRGTNGASEADDSIIRFEYDDIGELTKVTLPDASFMTFAFDAAHRMTGIADSTGNTLTFTLDNAGNRIQEDSKNSGGTVKRSLSRIYDSLNHLETFADAYATPVDFTYDKRGKIDTATDAVGRISDSDYDALGRLIQTIWNTAGSGADRPVTGFAYDARDHLTTIVDPKGLSTSYAFDGLDDLIQLVSPDTGATSYAYDNAGNLSSQTDARSITTNYAYDAIGRLTAKTFPTTAQNMSYYYDTAESVCASGETFTAGRLTKFTDQSGDTKLCYDRRGNLVRKVQTDVQGSGTYTVGATYDAADRISAVTYPSGAIVTYLRNANGQFERVDAIPYASGAQVTVVSAANYLPFGPLNTLTFGNGRVLTKAYDLNYGIDSVSDSASTNPMSLVFTLDSMGNVTGLTERTGAATTITRTYTYDALDRLTAQKNGSAFIESFAYDATGNRVSRTQPGLTYNYSSTSHQLIDTDNFANDVRTYDANGNLTQVGTGNLAPKYAYYNFNRMKEHKTGTTPGQTTTYLYNAHGERVSKQSGGSGPAQGTRFVYDQAGHLLGEYNKNGVRQKEYIWMGDVLVGVMQGTGSGSSLVYVETDHVGTPRVVVEPSTNTIIWRWDVNKSSFGEHTALQNPDGDGSSYKMNLRYPGQYFDDESGLHYNYFRDYEPETGRYVQSDPIGQAGGRSTYGYVNAKPLTRSDFYGLEGTGPVVNWVNNPTQHAGPVLVPGGFLPNFKYDGTNRKAGSQTTATATARTTAGFNISVECANCPETGHDDYVAKTVNVEMVFTVHKVASGLSGYEEHDEGQHIADLSSWGVTQGAQWAKSTAMAYTSKHNFFGKEDCEKDTADEIEYRMADGQSGLGAAFNASHYERDLKLQPNGHAEHTH